MVKAEPAVQNGKEYGLEFLVLGSVLVSCGMTCINTKHIDTKHHLGAQLKSSQAS